jgi:hypothetical protein
MDASMVYGVATVRIAHLSPDFGPADFCWRVAGSTTYSGPVLYRGPAALLPDAGEDGGDAAPSHGGDASWVLDATNDAPDAEGVSDAPSVEAATTMDAETEAGPPGAIDAAAGPAAEAGPLVGVSYGEITSSVRLGAAGTFDIALVRAGATTCMSPRFVAQVTVDPGKHATLAIVGLVADTSTEADPGRALGVASFVDDTQLDLLNARVRLIHAALGWAGTGPELVVPPLSASVGGLEIAGEIDPLHASSMSGYPLVDALGYSTVAPVLPPAPMSFRGLADASAEAWSTAPIDLDLLGGTLHTGFIVDGPLGSLVLVWCSDAATAASSPPVACEMFSAARGN